MTERALQLLEAAQHLTQDERDILAAELRRDPFEPQDVVDAAWAEEIERRIRDVEEGRAKTIPADEVFAKIRAQLHRARG